MSFQVCHQQGPCDPLRHEAALQVAIVYSVSRLQAYPGHTILRELLAHPPACGAGGPRHTLGNPYNQQKGPFHLQRFAIPIGRPGIAQVGVPPGSMTLEGGRQHSLKWGKGRVQTRLGPFWNTTPDRV